MKMLIFLLQIRQLFLSTGSNSSKKVITAIPIYEIFNLNQAEWDSLVKEFNDDEFQAWLPVIDSELDLHKPDVQEKIHDLNFVLSVIKAFRGTNDKKGFD